MFTRTRIVQAADGIWLATAPLTAVQHHAMDRTTGMSTHRAREFLAGRSLLRALLRVAAPAAAADEVVAHPGGKPYLRQHPGLGISVSHDRGAVAACVGAGRAVGIDVQVPDGSLERAWTWTVQEALVKTTGEGLAGRPWDIGVPPGRGSGTWRSCRWVSLRGRSSIPVSYAYRKEAA
jgi:4'-phosphopantetheinyl transferase